jgi:hypothetical protein
MSQIFFDKKKNALNLIHLCSIEAPFRILLELRVYPEILQSIFGLSLKKENALIHLCS